MADIDDDIDLRQYIQVILRRWWLILILGAVTGVVAFAISYSQPRKYETTSTVLLTRRRLTLSLAAQFPTVNEPIDTASRMNALLSLAHNDALAAETLKTLQNSLPEDARTIDNIKSMVQVSNSGDAILIKATARDPQLAADIANTWAEQVVSAINQAYSVELLPPEIEDQLMNAQSEYEEAQSKLEDFYQNNDRAYTEIQVEELQTLLDDINKEQSSRITKFIERKLLMEEIIIQAEALKQQLGTVSGSAAASAGDALAVLLARAGAFTIIRESSDLMGDAPPKSSDLSLDLQITDINNLVAGSSSYARDLDSLIRQAETEKVKTEQMIQEILQEIANNQQEQGVTEISARLRLIKSKLTNLQATERELTSRRDLSWKAYQALAEKVTEIKNATPASAQVSLASRAVRPENPKSRSVIRNTLIAFILGCSIAILIILVDNWWQTSKQVDVNGNPGS